MTRLLVKRLRPGARLPARASTGATGLDLFACLEGTLEVGDSPVLVPTGIAIEVEAGLDVQVRPRSGLAARGILAVLGTIDPDYRGEILVTLYALGGRPPHVVHDGDRIGQLVVSRSEAVELLEVTELSPTERGVRGHGSTDSQTR